MAYLLFYFGAFLTIAGGFAIIVIQWRGDEERMKKRSNA